MAQIQELGEAHQAALEETEALKKEIKDLTKVLHEVQEYARKLELEAQQTSFRSPR